MGRQPIRCSLWRFFGYTRHQQTSKYAADSIIALTDGETEAPLSSYHGGYWRYGHAGGGREPPPLQLVLPATAQPSPALTSLSPPQSAWLLAQLRLPMVRKGPSQQPIHHHAPVVRHPLRATGQWQPFCVCSSLLWLPVASCHGSP